MADEKDPFEQCRNFDGSYTVDVDVVLTEDGQGISFNTPQIRWEAARGFHGTADGCTSARYIKVAVGTLFMLRLMDSFNASVTGPDGKEIASDEARLPAGQRYQVNLHRIR